MRDHLQVLLRFRWPGLVGIACLLVLVGAALARYPDAADALQTRRSAAAERPVVAGIPQVAGASPKTPLLIDAVRRWVPASDHVRVLVGPAMDCAEPPGQLYWIAYQIAPRPIVCGPDARWWVLYRTGPMVLPSGSRTLITLAPDLRLVDIRPTGAGP